jgi:uncharacterized repeat protein (TIGR01451 family)
MTSIVSKKYRSKLTGIIMATVLLVAVSAQAQPTPTFSKIFVPDTIGPGCVSMLVFTIDNSQNPGPVGDLAFTDTLPPGMNLAAPDLVSNDCNGTVSFSGGDTITFSDGMVGAGDTCEIVVNVTAVAIDASDTTYANTSGNLTSNAGTGGTATDDLIVDIDRPGFSKSFAPSTVEFGSRSTLTFTIDNSRNGSPAQYVAFTDTLPAGMAVANPANASTDCDYLSSPTLTAVPGTNIISLLLGGVGAEGNCTVSADVIGGAIGSLGNVSGDLVSGFPTSISSGKAAAVLEVTGFGDLLELAKEFTDDPVPPGGTVTLDFTVTNKSRDNSAAGITFVDDLEATLSGLTPTLPPTPDPPCGAGSSLSFSLGVVTLAGGTLPPGGSCTFSVELSVPGGAVPGSYPNTAGPVSGDVGGSPEVGNVAGDLLFVVSFPILTKEFTDDPVAAGGTVTLEFTITNPETTSVMSGIAFVDELTAGSGDSGATPGFLPFPVSVGLPPTPDPPCGPGSSLALVSVGSDRQGLELTGGSLASAGAMGDSCTFSVTVDIPLGVAGGTYINTTEEISAVLDDFAGTPTVVGPPASDTIVVASAPTLVKEFTDDPVSPSGGPVALEFTLLYDPELPAPDATVIAFTDDLTALAPAVPGLVAASVDTNTCTGSTIDISTPTLIDFSGGTLAPGASCMVSLTLTVPAASPVGFHTNTTSDVTATVGGIAASNNPAEDDLLINALVFTKEFTDDPVIAGGTANLRFTLENVGPADATGIQFTDSLATILPGTPDVTVFTALPLSVCGGTLDAGSPTLLLFTDGSVLSGDPPCSFDVTVLVPAGIVGDTYLNVTSDVISSLGNSPAAVDGLTVNSTILDLSKAFTDDPVAPGGTVTLGFTLTNLSATETVTDIAFDDDLDAALTGLVTTRATTNTCGGMAAGFPAGLFEYSGGSLLPGTSCTITLEVDVPPSPLPGNVFPNTTTAVTGRVGALDVFGDPATDDLLVSSFTFSKVFGGPVVAGDTTTLDFTIENLDASSGVIGIAFSDDLDAVVPGMVATGLPAADVCGPGSLLTGTSFLTLTGGSLGPSGSCVFSVVVQVPPGAPVGTFTNTTSTLSQGGIPSAEPATADIVIEAAAASSAIPVTTPIGTVTLITLIALAALWRLRWRV